MLSNRESKFIKSLQLKKFRQSEGCLVAEGAKNVLELLQSDFEVTILLCTAEFIASHASEMSHFKPTIVKSVELEKIGSFKTNNACLAVAKIPNWGELTLTGTTLAFDHIKDPGNLGTIIRIADWYGVQQIVCTPDSVDCFNPKVISATMGSFTRVKVYYEDLEPLTKTSVHSYATSLDGSSIYDMKAVEPAIILFGNESTGLSANLQALAKNKIKIPGYGQAESLNVGVSVGVFCDNFMRKLKTENQ